MAQREYLPLMARRGSACPYCPNRIAYGDAIVRREGDVDFSHKECAELEDQIELESQRVSLDLTVGLARTIADRADELALEAEHLAERSEWSMIARLARRAMEGADG